MATGYYYYGARYYDPKRSFWLSVDPLAEITNSPYAYVWNDPVNFTDPTGLMGERVGGPKDGLKTVKDCFGANDDFDILSRKPGDSPGSAKTWSELKRELNNRPQVYQDVKGMDRVLIRMGDSRIPEYSKSDLDYAHNFLSSLATLAKKDGHATAAFMINHFLGGKGNSVTYMQKFLKQDQNYNDALTRNRSHIDKK